MNKNFVLIENGARVFGPNAVKLANETIYRYDKDYQLIHKYKDSSNKFFYDLEIGKTNYEIIKEYSFDNENIIETVKGIIESENIPKNLVNNLNIYISPYLLDKVKGYSVIYGLKEAEDYIVIPSEIKYLEENLYHELGHIYWNSVLMNNENFKAKYLEIYKLQTFKENIWEYNIEENFAEDFKVFMFEQKGKAVNKKTNIYYDDKVTKLILDNIKYIENKVEDLFPKVSIFNGNNKIIVNPKNVSLSSLSLERERTIVQFKIPKKYSISLQVCDSYSCYEVNNSLINLRPNDDYKVTIFYKFKNQKFEIGILNLKFNRVGGN